MLTKGRPKAWEASEDKAGMQGKPAHSWSGDLFFTCIYFQEHKCVFLVSSVPASQLIPLDWFTWCAGLFFPEYFQLFHSLPSARVRILTRAVHFSRDAFPAPAVMATLIWLPPRPSHLPFSMLPISIYVPLASILSTFYRAGIVLNSFPYIL